MDWLEIALDYGVSEFDFWRMTLAEIGRAIESKKRVIRVEKQDRAASDYTLALLIGRSYARLHNSSNTFPTLAEAYPSLFNNEEDQEMIQKNKNEISAIRFKLFAQSHNKKYKVVEQINE